MDTPPVVPFVDSDIVAGFVDSVVIVVEATTTKAEILDVTINRLKAVEANIAGLDSEQTSLLHPEMVIQISVIHCFVEL